MIDRSSGTAVFKEGFKEDFKEGFKENFNGVDHR